MRVSLVLLLAAAVSTGLPLSTEQRRNLSEIQYQFTSCGVTGRTGPPFRTCKDHYTASNSPIFRDKVLFEFEDYQGAQGFRVLKDGVYNITVVGAAGGRGICNVQSGGLGYRRTVQVELTTEFELLVMVGQRGIEPCSLIPMSDLVYSEICSSPPAGSVPGSADACNETWYNLTRAFDRNFYDTFGGAGGGGASLVRARNRTSRIFDDFPIIIAGGGGGSSSVLDYDTVVEIGARAQSSIFPNSVLYESFLNAQSRENDPDHGLPGVRGFRLNSANNIAGSGGGYSQGVLRPIEVDGRQFRSPLDFANGGVDCAQALLALSQNFPYNGASGGFGGGGGACGGGGAGGGYTGGATLDAGITVPGGGGFSFIGDNFSTSFSLNVIEDRLTIDRSDGYVNIVEANCGCIHECTVYTEDEQFQCWCPNNTVLAPDLRDCIIEFQPNSLMVQEIDSGSSSLDVTLVLINTTMYMFGVNALLSSVSSSNMDSVDDSQCLLLFLGTDAEVVAVSNTVSPTGVANMVALVEDASNGTIFTLSSFSSLLDSSIFVTGVLLVGSGDCVLATMDVSFFVSIQEPPNTDVPVQGELPMNKLTAAIDIAQSVLFPPPTTADTDPTFPPELPVPLSSGAIAGIVVAVIVFLVLVALVVLMLTVIVRFSLEHRTMEDRRVLAVSPDDDSPRYLVNVFLHKDSLVPNAAYSPFNAMEKPAYPDKNNAKESVQLFDGYEQLKFEDEGPSRDEAFQPRYGINVPDIDFFQYNRRRSKTILTASGWLYPRSDLTYMRELGEGQFGKVLLMKAKDIAGFEGSIPVAVKTLTSRDPEIIDKFREEAELMKKFSHPNVVSLLGYIPQEEGEDSAPLMILEYMPFGDLLDFLQSHSPTSGRVDVVTEKHFYKFGADVAKGLEFLSDNNYVHRDIAARNCLVGANLRIKIADFGLARGLQNKDYYKVGGSAVLPVKWMAPECLLYGVFTSASDVWSYGVLLWEIVTYGKHPLEALDIQDVIDASHDGTLQHERPENCPDNLHTIISQCHHHNSEERPTFSDIVKLLTNLIEPTTTANTAVRNDLEESTQI